MDENQLSENQILDRAANEPEKIPDNSKGAESNQEVISKEQGQSLDPAPLILGKFKSQEDLIKAYQDLEKLQGNQSAELGQLRQKSGIWNNISDVLQDRIYVLESKDKLAEIAQKYNKPEYFQDPSFRSLFSEAYRVMKDNLDVDYMIEMLEGYVSGRISAYERKKAAEAETDRAISAVKFDKNQKSSLKPAEKRLDEMTKQEIDDLLDRLL